MSPVLTEQDVELLSVFICHCVRDRRSKSHKDTVMQGLGLFGSAHYGLIPAISFF